MARIIGRLTARRVATAKPKKGKEWVVLADGGNLLLQVTTSQSGHLRKSWLFKYQLGFRRHELGLGPYPDVSLAQARQKAHELRAQLREDIDPLEARQQRRRALLAERARTVTFRDCAQMYLKLHMASWRNPKHAQQWPNTLRDYVYPKLGALAVSDIDAPMVLKCVEGLWSVKPVTAGRVLVRIRRILDYATANGFRSGDNPANATAQSLPKKSTIATVEHFPAMALADLPAFMHDLREQGSLTAKALEFLILTCARAGMVLGATFDEFDLGAKKVWTVPGARMKKGKEHRTPLSGRALAILRELPRSEARAFPIGKHAMGRLLNLLRPGAAVSVHGFRSCLKDWATERTGFPHAVVEAALAHAIPGAVEKAYRRTDLFDKRRLLMGQWASFLAMKPVAAATGDNVVTFAGTPVAAAHGAGAPS
jgi:integrase